MPTEHTDEFVDEFRVSIDAGLAGFGEEALVLLVRRALFVAGDLGAAVLPIGRPCRTIPVREVVPHQHGKPGGVTEKPWESLIERLRVGDPKGFRLLLHRLQVGYGPFVGGGLNRPVIVAIADSGSVPCSGLTVVTLEKIAREDCLDVIHT